MVRWALVGGIVLVVLIATALAIFGLGSSPKAGPKHPGNGTGNSGTMPAGGSTCLYPASTRLATTALSRPVIKTSAILPAEAKLELAATERYLAKHSYAIAVSPNGKQHIFPSHATLMVGKASTKATKLANVEDAAFSASGQRIIYERNPEQSLHKCAGLLLKTMTLSGKHRKLLFAGKFALVNTPAGSGSNAAASGQLQPAVLSSGLIVLVARDHLYAFDPAHHLVGSIEKPTLGAIYGSGSVNPLPTQEFFVSPNLRYMVETPASSVTSGTGVLKIRALPSGRVLPNTLNAAGGVAWSRSGNRLAFTALKPNASGQSSDVVETLNLKTSKLFTLKMDQAKYGHLTISNIRWSRDGKYVGFTGAPVTTTGAHALAFIAKWKGGKAHLLNPRAFAQNSRKKGLKI